MMSIVVLSGTTGIAIGGLFSAILIRSRQAS